MHTYTHIQDKPDTPYPPAHCRRPACRWGRGRQRWSAFAHASRLPSPGLRPPADTRHDMVTIVGRRRGRERERMRGAGEGGGGRGEGGTCASALSTTLYVVAVGRAPCARARPPAVHARMAPQGLLHSKGCEERNGSNGTNGSTGGTENLSSSRNLSASSAILAPPGARCTNARGRSLSGRKPLGGGGHDAGPGAKAASVFGGSCCRFGESCFRFRHQTPRAGGRAGGHRGVGERLEQRLAGGEV